ncbi:hypothetical protein [Halodesulfovibrio sp. MK-HDV]|jgi:hypothetical protein|uniref:hypothetical protein n=1 Tax=Halodesulfovibrio sp. MK-HDV TaxID=2599925 RepID=UPI00136EB069|nr:hypothetical protein [Halodesulfovibrio sp. MK-HDV]KAF1077636.1 hypothetical protein MKHDV_00092 [Halodesulfovibrio sp. MK-HDV]
MNEKAYAWAWNQEVESAEQKVLLLALAFEADEHNVCTVSYEELETKTVMDRSLLSGTIEQLKIMGKISIAESFSTEKANFMCQLVGVQDVDQWTRMVNREK